MKNLIDVFLESKGRFFVATLPRMTFLVHFSEVSKKQTLAKSAKAVMFTNTSTRYSMRLRLLP